MDAKSRTEIRARLVARAERESPATSGAPTRPTPVRPARRLFPIAISGRRLRARGAILVGVTVGAVAMSGISAASENAVPGDALYGMKRSTERAQLALTGSDLSRGQLFLDFARTRLAEAQALRDDARGLAAVLDDMDADTRQGVRLLTSSAVQRADATVLDLVNAFVTSQRQAVARLLEIVPGAQRERLRSSLSLLDVVRRRSDALRAMLSCPGVGPAGRDQLGPQPRSCPTPRAATPAPTPTASPEPHTFTRDEDPARTQPGQPAGPPGPPGQGPQGPGKPSAHPTG